MAENLTFGEWLRHRRRDLDLTQRELGLQAGCAQVTIRKIEANILRPSRQLAELLVETLGVPSDKRDPYVRFARGGKYPEELLPTLPENNLPLELTRFIGREQEIIELLGILRRSRLITLTGAGGVGKSRLALKVAAKVLDCYQDGAWFVELASLTDPELIAFTIAVTLGLQNTRHESYRSLLIFSLQAKKLLLVLDNCEHLIEACANLVYALLQQCPGISLLVTCRETLDIEGEVVYRIPSLVNLDPVQMVDHTELEQTDSVRLFTDRAQAILPGFSLTSQNVLAVSQICYRLDGIPLAIELAAARVNALSVEQIAGRLNDRFRLLIIGNRTALPRHRTLRASIDWSYNLLDRSERLIFQRLSVFAGSWTLEAAEGACAYGDLQETDIVDLLTGLVKKSLLQTVRSPDGMHRFRMLETIRQYANEKLEETGQVETARDHHLAYFLVLAENLEFELRGRKQVATLDLLELALDNLRQAIEWALKTGADAGLRLACALMWLCHIRHYQAEGIRWIERGLALLQESPITIESGEGNSAQMQGLILRARALWILGDYRFQIGEYSLSQVALEESLAIYRTIGVNCYPEIQQGLAWNLAILVGLKLWVSDRCQVEQMNQEAFILFRASDDLLGQAVCLQQFGDIERDPIRKKELYQEELALMETLGNDNMIATAYLHIGSACLLNGDNAEALAAFEASRSYYEKVNNRDTFPWLWQYLGLAAQLGGDLQRAEECYDNSMADFREIENDFRFSFYLFDKRVLAMVKGLFDLATELNEAASQAAIKTNNQDILASVLYFNCWIARIQGDMVSAQQYAEDGDHQEGIQGYLKMLFLLELGYLALERRDFTQSRASFQEGMRVLIDNFQYLDWIQYPVIALATLAVREAKLERAARLYGTRWCRGGFYFLSPMERTRLDNNLAAIRTALGDNRFDDLYEEGRKLTIEQAIHLAWED